MSLIDSCVRTLGPQIVALFGGVCETTVTCDLASRSSSLVASIEGQRHLCFIWTPLLLNRPKHTVHLPEAPTASHATPSLTG